MRTILLEHETYFCSKVKNKLKNSAPAESLKVSAA